MLKSAPNAKKKSPLVWVGGAAALIAVYTLMSGGDTPVATTTTKSTKKGTSAKDNPYDTPQDHEAKFATVSLTPADVFSPLIKKPILAINKPLPPGGVVGIPAALTGGEGNWFYTGIAELDGVRQGLLENKTTGESAYVGVGDAWKDARIVSIDVGVIHLSGRNGGDFEVPIVQYGEAPGAGARTSPIVAAGGQPQPLNVPGGALSGAIGGGIGVRPLGGGQANVPQNLQGMDPNAQASVPDNGNNMNNGNGRNRRGRRNRNNNQGDLGVNNVP